MKSRILDLYFKRPILWDCLLSLFMVFLIEKLLVYFKIGMPEKDQILSVISDLSNISLTSSGFILTLLTLLITFKSSSRLKLEDANSDNSRFEIFFASHLYFVTVKLLKYCIISLIVVSIIGYCLKLVSVSNSGYLFKIGVVMLFLLVMTLLRCLLILTKVLELQKNTNS
jgi:hypothetical protein